MEKLSRPTKRKGLAEYEVRLINLNKFKIDLYFTFKNQIKVKI